MNFALKTILVLLTIVCSSAASPGSTEVQSAVQKVARDYIYSWYTGDARLMEATIHPSLVKRSVLVNPSVTLAEESAQELLRKTAAGGASRRVAVEERTFEILDFSAGRSIAQVRIRAARWDELLHLVQLNGEWKIVNVLWEMHSKELGDE